VDDCVSEELRPSYDATLIVSLKTGSWSELKGQPSGVPLWLE